MKKITQCGLKDLLEYNLETGVFDKLDDAINARKSAFELYGFHVNHKVKLCS